MKIKGHYRPFKATKKKKATTLGEAITNLLNEKKALRKPLIKREYSQT